VNIKCNWLENGSSLTTNYLDQYLQSCTDLNRPELNSQSVPDWSSAGDKTLDISQAICMLQ
jgi:hypothetical protein